MTTRIFFKSEHSFATFGSIMLLMAASGSNAVLVSAGGVFHATSCSGALLVSAGSDHFVFEHHQFSGIAKILIQKSQSWQSGRPNRRSLINFQT